MSRVWRGICVVDFVVMMHEIEVGSRDIAHAPVNLAYKAS